MSAFKAVLLSGEHVEQIIRFDWRFPTTNVHAVVTGELREIHHDATDLVSLRLAGDDSPGDSIEFSVHIDTLIQVME